MCLNFIYNIFILIQETRKQNLLEVIKIAVRQFVDLCRRRQAFNKFLIFDRLEFHSRDWYILHTYVYVYLLQC